MESILAFPPVLRFEPSASCNLKCQHCPTGLGRSPKGIMSERVFGKLLDQIKGHHFRAIVPYHGGEPLLNKNFFSMVKKVRPLCDTIKMDTNGMLLNHSHIVQLLVSGIDILVVSLDGNSAEENDRIRVGGNYHQVIASLKKLLELKKKLGLSKPLVKISNVRIAERGMPRDLEPPAFILEDLKEFEGWFEWILSWAIIWPGLETRIAPSIPELDYCDNIINTITVRWNGDVVPCCYDLTSKMVMGNILSKNIENIWQNDKYRDLRDKIARREPPTLCQNCPDIYPNKVMTVEDFPII